MVNFQLSEYWIRFMELIHQVTPEEDLGKSGVYQYSISCIH